MTEHLPFLSAESKALLTDELARRVATRLVGYGLCSVWAWESCWSDTIVFELLESFGIIPFEPVPVILYNLDFSRQLTYQESHLLGRTLHQYGDFKTYPDHHDNKFELLHDTELLPWAYETMGSLVSEYDYPELVVIFSKLGPDTFRFLMNTFTYAWEELRETREKDQT